MWTLAAFGCDPPATDVMPWRVVARGTWRCWLPEMHPLPLRQPPEVGQKPADGQSSVKAAKPSSRRL